MNTPCKNCVFAIYEDITQTGCKYNMIQRFEETGANIVPSYDEEREFFVIEERVCPLARGTKWLNKFVNEVDEQLFKELNYNYNIVLLAKNDIQELELSVKKIMAGKSLPFIVTIIKPPSSKLEKQQIVDILESNHVPLWKIMQAMEEKTPEKMFSEVIKLTKHHVYILIKDHEEFPEALIDKINHFAIYNVNRFGAILGTGVFVVYKNEYLRAYYLDNPEIEVIEQMRQESDVYYVSSLDEVINYEGHPNPLSV